MLGCFSFSFHYLLFQQVSCRGTVTDSVVHPLLSSSRYGGAGELFSVWGVYKGMLRDLLGLALLSAMKVCFLAGVISPCCKCPLRRAACWLGVGEELSRAGPWAGTPPWALSVGTELCTTRCVNQQHFSLLRYCTSHWGLKQSSEILNGFRHWYCWSLPTKELCHKQLIRLRNLFL